MLTRSQVAKRLGKSIATVRRLEGSRLHPTRDREGVYRFDRDEVSALACGLRSSFSEFVPILGGRQRDERSGDAIDAEREDCRRGVRVTGGAIDATEARVAERAQSTAKRTANDDSLHDEVLEALSGWLESRSRQELRYLALGGMDDLLELIVDIR